MITEKVKKNSKSDSDTHSLTLAQHTSPVQFICSLKSAKLGFKNGVLERRGCVRTRATTEQRERESESKNNFLPRCEKTFVKFS